MRKIVNFRFFTFLLLFCCIGIVLSLFLYDNVIFDYVILFSSLIAIVLLLLILKRKGILFSVIIFFFAFFYLYTVGVLYSRISDDTNTQMDYLEVRIEYVSVDGSVVHCSFDKGEASLTVDSEGMILKEGMNLTLENVHVQSVSVKNEDGYDFYALAQGKRYTVSADSIYAVNSSNPSLSESIRVSIKHSCENLSEDVKGIVIALLTGDKYGIGEETYSDYRRSGIAHILAVSGLHVVFLYSAVDFILRKFKINKKIRAFLSIPVLLLFSATCGFSPSVIRASVMTIMHSIIPATSKKRYDTLSVMSLSAVILLIFNPMTLFSYGFLLSYSAVIGIVAYSHKFNRLLNFMPKFLRNSLSVSIAASLATFPLTVSFFGEVSMLSAIANVLILPVMSVFYGVLFLTAIIVAIFPFLEILLSVCGLVIYYVNFVAMVVSAIPFATLSSAMPIWFTIGYYTNGILLSDYVFLPKEGKMSIVVLFILQFVFYFALCGKSLAV